MQCIDCKTNLVGNFCDNCGKKSDAININNDFEQKVDIMSPKRRTVKSPNSHDVSKKIEVDEKYINAEEGPFSHGRDIEFNKKYEHTVCYEYRGQPHFRPKKDAKYWVKNQITPLPLPSPLPLPLSPPLSSPGVQIENKEAKDHVVTINNKKMLTILIPFYNEEASDLMMTLNSLYPDFASIKAMDFDIHILLVMDGWWKASESMKKLIQGFFKPSHNEAIKPWWNSIKPIASTDDLSTCVSTFIVQRMSVGGQSIAEIDIGGSRLVKISMVVKRDNRRKINAHDWMLSSFAEHYQAQFVFLTDCGTLFENKCLTLLTKELLSRPDCTAVSGRQRVMSAKQQGSKNEGCGIEAFYRGAQRYDYESSLASFVGAFSLFGMLPVIPGPCGLYRYEAIREVCVPFYLDSVAAHPSECGILMANLNLAEDRVLSYAAVLQTHKNAFTAYVPEAIFYFAAETSPMMLFQQRRRWINGTIAGYIWLLTKPGHIWRSGLRFWNKPFLSLLLLCQLFMYIALAVSPAIFATSFYWSLRWMQEQYLPQSFGKNYFSEIFLSIYAAIYIFFVFRHSNPKFQPAVSTTFVHIITFINMIAMLVILISMGVGLKIMYDTRRDEWSTMNGLTLADCITILILWSMFGPLLLALLHAPKSFMLMLISIIPFYLLLPTTVTYIGAYSYSRLWDLSWGNRPSEKSSLKATQSSEIHKKNGNTIKKIGNGIAYTLVIINFLVGIGLVASTEREMSLIVLALFIFAWSAIQMLFSGIYFIFRNTRRLGRIGGRWCCVKICNCYSKKEWDTGET